MKTYIVQTAHGPQADTNAAKWQDAAYCSTIEQAREKISAMFADKADGEDRGEDYEANWMKLAERSMSAHVGNALAFDEFAARIVEDAD